MEMNEISKDTQKSIKTRTITGLVLTAIFLPCVILGNWFYIALVVFVVGVGLHEIIKSTGNKYPLVFRLILYVFVYSFVFWVFFQQANALQLPAVDYVEGLGFIMHDIRISTMGVGFLIALLFLFAIMCGKTDLRDIFYLFTMCLFLGFAGQSLLFLRFCPASLSPSDSIYNTYSSSLLIFFVAAATMLNDICAYFVGIMFGKHKMAPVISPKKTWEGFFGGIVLGSILAISFALISDLVFGLPILDGILDAEHWYYIVLVSVCLCLSSVLGDLMFSTIKRCYQIKDFGTIFPGHGGVLDRFDSILVTAMLSAIVIAFIYYNPLFGVLV